MLSWLHHKSKIHCILCTDGSISVSILYFRITAILPILITQQFTPLKDKLALMKLLHRTLKIVMNTQTFFAQSTYKNCHIFFSAICQIRLDFETFKIAQVTTTTGTCDSDKVSFTSPAGRNPPSLCGTLTDTHSMIFNIYPSNYYIL